MSILRYKYMLRSDKGPLRLSDCGIMINPGEDRVLQSDTEQIRSLHDGIARAFVDIQALAVYVLYQQVWLLVDGDDVRVGQDPNGNWVIVIKKYNIQESV